ncbi:hypothetical protein [Neptunomonas phycophila]|uniref:hypothetical protein n=1 Tax=Neptunomonas phycophila TaxID=1572645 RepID=UPI0011151809|nr:hypothetical protein [Neptunomonas phycophila]
MAIAISIMFSMKDDIKGKGYYESIKYDFNRIFFYEDILSSDWELDKNFSTDYYGNFDNFKEIMFEMHHSTGDVVGMIISFLLVNMVIPYFIMGYLFTAVFHPIVVDPKRKIIYTVKRGKVYLFKRSDVSNREYPFFDEKGAVISCDHGKGVSVRLKSIDRNKYRTFKMGVFPPFKDMQIYYLDKIFTALDYSDESSRKHYAHTDYFRYLRWITTVSLYPSFLCKKVDDPHYLAQIDQYLATREKWKHIKK